MSVAAWVRHAGRQVTLDGFAASWRAEEGGSRSYESGYYHRRFQLRLDHDMQTKMKMEMFMQTFHRSAAEVICQLIAQATREDFPASWQLGGEDCCHGR